MYPHVYCYVGGIFTIARNVRPLVLLVILFVSVAVTFSLNTPLLEGADEPAHFEYILNIVRGQGLPILRIDGARRVTYEAHQPPLYYLAAALAIFWIDAGDYESLVQMNPHTGYDPLAATNKNLFIHTRRESFPYAGAVLAMHLARWVSALFGVGAVIATYGLAQTLFPRRPELWSGAAAVVGFVPQFGFISGVISNDSAATFVVALTLWQIARISMTLERHQDKNGEQTGRLNIQAELAREFALLGVLLGLAPLTKESGLVLLPFAMLVIGTKAWLSRTPRIAMRGTLIVLPLVLLIAGWWYVLQHAVYGFWFGSPDSANPAGSLSLEGFLQQWTEIEISFWGLFGWNTVLLPQVVYDALHGVTLLALIGLIIGMVRRKEWTRSEIFALGALSVWTLLVCAAFVRWLSATIQAHGRLLFPALPAFAIIVCWGLLQWSPRRWRPLVIAGFATALFALSGWSATVVTAAAYPQAIRLSASALEQIPNRVDANLSGQIALLGYRLRASKQPERAVVDVVVYWKAMAAMDVDYTVTVQVFGEDGTRVGHLDTYPVSGMYLTRDWMVGEILQDEYPVAIEPSAKRPLRANVVVGMYNLRTDKALPVIQPDGRRVGRVTLGQIDIE